MTKHDDVDIGEHCWAIADEKLLVVLKTDERSCEVCGAWECGMRSDEIEIVEIIKKPKEEEGRKLYYM